MSPRILAFWAPDDWLGQVPILDEWYIDASFDSPSAHMSKLSSAELLPAARMLAHFSALDRG